MSPVKHQQVKPGNLKQSIYSHFSFSYWTLPKWGKQKEERPLCLNHLAQLCESVQETQVQDEAYFIIMRRKRFF